MYSKNGWRHQRKTKKYYSVTINMKKNIGSKKLLNTILTLTSTLKIFLRLTSQTI